MKLTAFLTTIALVGSGVMALAQDHKAHATTPGNVQWGPALPVLPKGAQMAVLAGDPGKPGPAAHQHPTAEAVRVIAGEFHFGMGAKLDDLRLRSSARGALSIYRRI